MSTTKKVLASIGIVVAVLLLLILSNRGSEPVVPADDSQAVGGGAVTPNTDRFTNGAGLGDQIVAWKTLEIGRADNNGGWKNSTGRTVYVDLAEVTTTGTASSSFTFVVATSTTENISDTATPYAELIDSYALATSSPARTINSIENAGTNGIEVVPVDPDEWVSLRFLPTNGIAACQGIICESATSTNRGFNVEWRLRYHYAAPNR